MAVSLAERPGLNGPDRRTPVNPTDAAVGAGAPRVQLLQRWLAFLVPFGAYVTGACLLALKYHSYIGDAQAREANGFYVLFGRDPHLAAIGFVWNPGTSIVEMPLLLLKGVFPALIHEMLDAGIMSSVAMAGTCYQLFRFLEDQRVGPFARWSILACFALNPMIISYGADGMSEAWFCFCLVTAARYLSRWLNDRSLRSLVVSAVFIGFAYIFRNESIAASAAATVLVFGATYIQQGSLPSRYRRGAALMDAVIYVIPAFVAFSAWAIVSWIIVGHPFEQYSSAYGTASQLKFLGLDKAGGGKLAHLRYASDAVWLLAPLLPLMIVGSAYRAWRRRDPAILAVLAVLGAVCCFEVAAYTVGQIAWALRYVIYVIPLSAMVAGCMASRAPLPSPGWRVVVSRRHSFRWRYGIGPLLSVALLLPGVFTTENLEFHSNIDSLDQQVFDWILFPHAKASLRWTPFSQEWKSIGSAARQLDAMHLSNGEIMVDTEEPCIPTLILESNRPTQFLIPNDVDFKGKIGSPYEFGVRYLMVPSPTVYGSVDAINLEYPTLYDTGAGIATLAKTVTMSNCPSFRLYRLTPNVT